jgi:dTDP-4-dehydrorhamnose reductase
MNYLVMGKTGQVGFALTRSLTGLGEVVARINPMSSLMLPLILPLIVRSLSRY